MAQKKPTTPFEQHSSSSDDEEEEVSKGEEEATPLADSSSDDEETSSNEEGEDEEDTSDEEEVTLLAPVKPVVVQSVRAKSTQQPDLAPATAPAGKKRPTESMAVSKKIKKKRVAEEVVKKIRDYPKTPPFQRVFSEKDEIDMLNALLDYSGEKCIDPIEDFTDFYNFVKKYIHVDVTRSQVSGKIKKMKSKYKNHASKKKETFGKAHDQSCYNLSKKIWGKSSSACGGSELKRKGKRIPKMKNMTPGLQIPQVVVEEPARENISLSELAKTRDVVGMMCLSDDTFKKVLEFLSDDEVRAALEDKLKNIVTAELELNYKRLELSRELMKLFPGHRG